jgi:hypothetical protein
MIGLLPGMVVVTICKVRDFGTVPYKTYPFANRPAYQARLFGRTVESAGRNCTAQV